MNVCPNKDQTYLGELPHYNAQFRTKENQMKNETFFGATRQGTLAEWREFQRFQLRTRDDRFSRESRCGRPEGNGIGDCYSVGNGFKPWNPGEKERLLLLMEVFPEAGFSELEYRWFRGESNHEPNDDHIRKTRLDDDCVPSYFQVVFDGQRWLPIEAYYKNSRLRVVVDDVLTDFSIPFTL